MILFQIRRDRQGKILFLYSEEGEKCFPLNGLSSKTGNLFILIFVVTSMPKIRSAGSIARKWARVTPERSEDYKHGVENPKKDWGENTKRAKESWKGGIQEAIAKDRFAKGVEKAGTKKWQEKAKEKGTLRWGPGVAIAQDDYEKGFAPYRETIEKTDLPPRYAKGDPRNIERVKVMAAAMRKTKTG